MRFSGIYAALCICIVLLVAGTALGSEMSGQFSISPMVGSYTLGNPTKSYSTTKPVVEVKGGYNLNEYFGLELNVAYAQARRNNNNQTLFKYGGDVLLHLMPEGDLVPFLALGAGGYNYVETNRGVSTSANSFIDGGGGIKYRINDSVALRMDGRINYVTSKTDFKQVVLLAGLHFPFGRTKSSAKLPERVTAEEVRQMEVTSSKTAPGDTQPSSMSPQQPDPAVTATITPAETLTGDAGTPPVQPESGIVPVTTVAGAVSAESTGRKTVVTDIIIDKNYIDILVESPIADYKTLELNEPERLAIYLQTTAWGLAKRFIAVNRFGVSNIRVGIYPDSVTIVLDSPGTVFPSYRIEKKDAGLRITFTAKPVTKAKTKRSSASKK